MIRHMGPPSPRHHDSTKAGSNSLHDHARRQPVAREVFLREFWACFRRLEDAADEMVGKAAYFRFLTLLGETPLL